MNTQIKRTYLPLLAFFAVTNCIFFFAKKSLAENKIDYEVLAFGNLLVFAVTITSLFFHIKGFSKDKAQVLIQSIYISLTIKMIAVASAVIIYASVAAKPNRTAIYICMGLYFIYSYIEVRTIFRLLKQK